MKSLLTLLFVALLTQVSGQEVIATAGDYFDMGTYTFSTTIGEPVTETFTASETHLTQGFQQPVDAEIIISVNEQWMTTMKVWPNPTQGALNLQVEIGTAELQLFNLSGQLLMNEIVNSDYQRFDISHLPSGSYVVRLVSEGKVATEQIQKIN